MTMSIAHAAAVVIVGMSLIAKSGDTVAQSSVLMEIATSNLAKPNPKPAMQTPTPNHTLKAVQRALNKEGAKLRVDGFIGPKTRSALRLRRSVVNDDS